MCSLAELGCLPYHQHSIADRDQYGSYTWIS